MKTVNGELSYQVYVTCPECNRAFDLVDQDAHNDYSIADCVFGNDRNGPEWNGTGLTFICPECDTEFELGDIEY